MRRLSTTYPFTCVTCEVEIVGPPAIHLGLPFCCGGCAAGGPCICSYDAVAVDDVRVRHCLDVADGGASIPADVEHGAIATAPR